MLKTISAALLAVSVFAAPAFAATGRTAPAIKAAPAKASVKAGVLNANARMDGHHHQHYRHNHHRHHKHIGATHSRAKVGFRHASPTTPKRG
jgi:hypothetical protein